MAFPAVVGTPAQSQALSGNLTLTMPSGIVAGNTLVAIVGGDSDSDATMTGWDKIGYNSNGTQGTTVWARIATGSDSGVHTGGSKGRFAHVYQIEGSTGDTADVVAQMGTTSSMNPPNLNMSVADDYLWLASCRNNADITSAPTSFTDPIETNFFSSAWLMTARRQLNASSLDPGAFGGTVTAAHSCTIAIRPAVPVAIALPHPAYRNPLRSLLTR